MLVRLDRVFSTKKTKPANEIVFKVAGRQYQQLVEWRRSTDERILRQELETGKSPRGFELDEDWLKIARTALKQGVMLPPWYGTTQGAHMVVYYIAAHVGDQATVGD